MRALAWFWAALGAALFAGVIRLQSLGPPPPRAAPTAVVAPPAAPYAEEAPRPGRSTAGPVTAPDTALLEPAPAHDGSMLPKTSIDGRLPMQAYARWFDAGDKRPKVGLVLAGVGLNEADSLEAIRALPGEVTLAFSPYATHSAALLEVARQAGHETLISLPLEPSGYYVNDPGDHTLLTGAAPAENRARLDWALGRIQGYVGATGALGDMRGERFAGAADQMDGVLDQLGARGLLYVDGRIGAPPLPHVWSHGIDVVVDEQSAPAEIDARLARLEQVAKERGAALGLVGVVRPGAVARIAAWARTLSERRIALAPVSALAAPPASQ